METQKFDYFFKKKFKIEFCPYPEKRYHPGFVNISSTLVIDTLMKKSSRNMEIQHGNQKFDILFQISSKLNFDLYFDLS